MFHHSASRSQRPRGFKVKQAFQVSLFLAICIWLLYQVKQSHGKRKDYGGTVEKRIITEYKTVDFGRKGNAGSSEGEKMISGDRIPGKNDRGNRDDDLDRNAEEESVTVGREDSRDRLDDNEKEAEIQGDESGVGQDGTSNQVRDGLEVVGTEKDDSEDDAEESATNDEDRREPNKQESEALGSDEDSFSTLQIDSDDKFDLEKDKKDSKDSEEENFINDERKEDEMETNRQAEESKGSKRDQFETQLRDDDVGISSDKDEEESESAEEEINTYHKERESKTEEKESLGEKRDHFDNELSDGDEAMSLNKDGKDSKNLGEENVANDENERNEKEQNKEQEDSKGIDEVKFDKENDGDEALASDRYQNSKVDENKSEMLHNETDKSSIRDQSETENGGEGFLDVNGVPQDGLELVSSTSNDEKGDERTPTLDYESTSRSGNQTGISANTTFVSNDEKTKKMVSEDQVIVVKQVERGISLSEETKNKSSLNGVKTVSESFDDINKSNMNKTSETLKDDDIVSDNSTPAPQNEKEPVSLQTLRRDENELDRTNDAGTYVD